MNQEDRLRAQSAFYDRCVEILGTSHEFRPWRGRRPNRWNNRHPGNGRFPGFGCVRWFGPRCIHVMLEAPERIARSLSSEEAVFALLASVAAREDAAGMDRTARQ
jgi:hypothetical protein